jgi:dihydropteroate synthase
MDGAFEWGPLLEGGPLFVGILNATPDSFSDGGRFLDPAAALAQAEALRDGGVRMLDVGAESTRPGAGPVSEADEWARLEPVLAALRRALPDLPLSLDTRHAAIAARGLDHGATVLNDVTGFSDPALLDLAVRRGCGLIAMRSRRRGDRLVMPDYGGPGEPDDRAARAELAQVRDRLLGAGVARARILLDPGFGFGTTYREDFALWRGLGTLPGWMDWPADRFCVGISRKRFLAWRSGDPGLPPQDRDGLTASAHGEALALGFRVFRTHGAAAGPPGEGANLSS